MICNRYLSINSRKSNLKNNNTISITYYIVICYAVMILSILSIFCAGNNKSRISVQKLTTIKQLLKPINTVKQ